MTNIKRQCNMRCKSQWIMGVLLFIVLILGWFYPYLGFIVPLTMAVGMIGGLFGGRFVCGNLCPRGSFWDRHFSLIVKAEKNSPAWLKNLYFRWVFFAFMMSIMFYRASTNITSLEHWGRIFIVMCAFTTAIGIVGSIFYHRRFWCVFCPIGTFAATVSGHKNPLKIDDAKCISCHLCDKACPIGINPQQYRQSGLINDRDCLRCLECVNVCPKEAISR